MVKNTFPKKPYIGQTYVGLDKCLYYWNGGKWKFVSDLSKGIGGNQDLQGVTDNGNVTSNTMEHAPASRYPESVNLGQLKDGSVVINAKDYYKNGEPALRLDKIYNKEKAGLLYNAAVLLDERKITSSDDWDIPTKQQWLDFLNYVDENKIEVTEDIDTVPTVVETIYPEAGGILKKFDTIGWMYPNVRASGEFSFSVIGAGVRHWEDSEFKNLGKTSVFWSKTQELSDGFWAVSFRNTNSKAVVNVQHEYNAFSIRLVNTNTTLLDGETGMYAGNNGVIYPTICINGIEYTTVNLAETHFRSEVNGQKEEIVIIEDGEDWALSSKFVSGGGEFLASACYYNNNVDSATSMQFSEIYDPHTPFINNVKWHPDGLIFSFIPKETTDEGVELPPRVIHTDGELFIHYWVFDDYHVIPEVPDLPEVDPIDPTLGIPVFVPVDYYQDPGIEVPEGETPPEPPVVPFKRVKSYGRMRFQVECVNAVVITYAIDQASIDGGNVIDEVTGVVEFDETWTGDTVITATVVGQAETVTVDHTITTVLAETVGYISIPAQTFQPDPKPFYRKWKIPQEVFDLKSDDIHYLYAKLPVYTDELANVIVTTEFFGEKVFQNYLFILMGICNSKQQKRTLSMLWGNSGDVALPEPIPVKTRWVNVNSTCIKDGEGNYTGDQLIEEKKQEYDREDEVWFDTGETRERTVRDLMACPPPEPDKTRWVEIPGTRTCLTDTNGDNTGEQEYTEKKQIMYSGTDIWVDLEETRVQTIRDLTACPPPEPDKTRWVEVEGSKHCLTGSSGDNTGIQEYIEKKQIKYSGTDVWVDLGETRDRTITNLSDCPLPAPDPMRVAINTGQSWTVAGSNEYSFSGSKLKLTTPINTTNYGYNYVFISFPTDEGKPTITNNLNMDMSDQFSSAGTDNKSGYQNNTVWKMSSLIGTSGASTFYVQ